MRILGIETSCDETSAAVVENGRAVLSCVIASSGKDFEKTGGVIPEDAARKQLESILPVIQKSLRDASMTPKELDAIAVTFGPGLLGSLLVGTTTARTFSSVWNTPIIPVHHTLGHLSSTWLFGSEKNTEPSFPILTLSVSGGHSDLWYRKSHTQAHLLGSTRDDAAGEAFDKGAVMLGLPYPGGPALASLALSGDSTTFAFPLPLAKEKTCDFSFSGLKTSLKYLIRDLGNAMEDPKTRASVAASYEHAICTHLCKSIEEALVLKPDTKELHIVGGVSANEHLRTFAVSIAKKYGMVVRWPTTLRYCTDNAAMIASAGYYLFREKPDIISMPFLTKATTKMNE